MRRDQGFVLAPLRVGALYKVRGGHILRYHGLWGTNGETGPRPGHSLALQHPKYPVESPAVGYSAAHEDVRLLTVQDLEWLPRRIASARAKKVDHTDAEIAIKELK